MRYATSSRAKIGPEQISMIEGDTIEAKLTAPWEKAIDIDLERTTLMRNAMSSDLVSDGIAKLLRRVAALDRYSRRVDSARRRRKRSATEISDRTNPIHGNAICVLSILESASGGVAM